MLLLPGLILLAGSTEPAVQVQSPDNLLLKNYRPISLFKNTATRIEKAKLPVIDAHAHPLKLAAGATNISPARIDQWVKAMDACGIEKAVLLTGKTGERFDADRVLYSKYPDRFELWCGFNLTNVDKPDFGAAAVAELVRCYTNGAKGVGELYDNGGGLGRIPGLHIDDPRLDPMFDKCAELKMPVNVHVADPLWMYQLMNANNDGLMNAYVYRHDAERPGANGHEEMIKVLENAVKRHSKTTFIACHLANLECDLNRLGTMLDTYSNLYADISGRYAETATIPRAAQKFFGKYQDRLLYGTDMRPNTAMYRLTFRVLESEDEHFYAIEQFEYHWPLYGLGLDEKVLKKIYRENALRILSK